MSMCPHVCLCTPCMPGVWGGQKTGLDSIGTGTIDGGKWSCGYFELNPSFYPVSVEMLLLITGHLSRPLSTLFLSQDLSLA